MREGDVSASSGKERESAVKLSRMLGLAGSALGVGLGMAVAPLTGAEAQEKKPNIVVIMGDDIGMWNIGAYSRGLMSGRTPNLDQIAKGGMLFTDYYAEAS